MRLLTIGLLALSLSTGAFAQGAAPKPGPRGAPSAAAAPPVATLLPQGSIEVRHTDGSTSGAVAAAVPLTAGDEIRVPPTGRATIRFADGSEIRLEPSSVFTVHQAESKLFSMFLNAGKLWASVTKNRGRRFEVRTPTAVASVRGTEFSVEVKSLKETIASVREGLVSVQGLVEGRVNGSEVLLNAGHMLSVVGGAVGIPEEIRGMLPPPAMPAGPKEAAAPKAEDAARTAVMRTEMTHEVAAQVMKEAAQGNAVSAATNPQAPEGTTLLQSTAYQQSADAASGPRPNAMNGTRPDGNAPVNGDAPPSAPPPTNAPRLNAAPVDSAPPPMLPPPGAPGTGTAPPVQNTIVQPPPDGTTTNPTNIAPLDPNYLNNCPTCPPLR